MTRNRQWPLAFWMPFLLIWLSFLVSYAGIPVILSVLSGLANIVTAALLGFGIWQLTSKMPWPSRLQSVFVGSHILAALVFATIWAFSALLMLFATGELLLEGTLEHRFEFIDRLEDFLDDYEDSLWENPLILIYRLVLGFWIYGAISATSYAIQARSLLEQSALRAAKAESLAEKRRMQALGQHLGPHFLFNALHSVSAMIPDQPEKAEEAIEQLGDLLRYLLRDWSHEQVTLAEELAFARSYLLMQQLRFQDQIKFTINVDETLLSQTVPPLTLQPILENCYKHGELTRSPPGEIALKVIQHHETIRITIEDNGKGCNQTGIAPGDMHGLPQLARRLEYLYATRATMSVQSKSGAGYKVTITLPMSETNARV